MKHLKMINHKFYSHFDPYSKMLFTMKYGDRGVYGSGKAWYLSVTYGSEKQTIATFCVRDDGHRVFIEDYGARLWREDEALKSADDMVDRMLNA